MTDAHAMKTAVGAIINERLSTLEPLPYSETSKLQNPRYNQLREALLDTEQDLRKLIQGGEEEVHEWLAVIHYTLADERARLLGY